MQKYSWGSMACFYLRTACCRANDIVASLRQQRECATDSDYFPSSIDMIAFKPLRSKRKCVWRPCRSVCLYICLWSNISCLMTWIFVISGVVESDVSFLKIGAVTYFTWGCKWLCARSFRSSWLICVITGHRKYSLHVVQLLSVSRK